MNSDTYDFVHLAIFALGGSVKGKTKLQKLVYFLGVISGHDEELGYRPHYYGPYSADVADAVDRLVARNFLKQAIAGGSSVDRRGFEVTRTDYEITADGKKIAVDKATRLHRRMAEIKHAASIVSKVRDEDYVKLSIAAKTYFMLKKNPNADLSVLAKTFGWQVDKNQIEEAKRMLSILDP